MAGGGAFLSGLADGYTSGKNLNERKKIRDHLDSLDQGGEGRGVIPPGEPGYKGSTPFVPQNGQDRSYKTDGGQERPRSRGVVPQDDRDILALTLDAEAGGEGYEGMLAAGSVIANRASTDGYGGNIKDVIMKPGQFSAWNSVTGYADGEGGLDMSARSPSKDAYAAADAILSGNYQDPTGGATHYYNPSEADPEWGREAGEKWHQIGNHIFGKADAGRETYTPPSKADAGQSKPQANKEAGASLSKPIRGVLDLGEKIIDQFYS